MSKAETYIIDFDSLDEKRAFMQKCGSLRGSHKVTLKPSRPLRSLKGNDYYFAGCVEPFKQYLIETDGNPYIDNEQAHDTLKLAVLGAAKNKDGISVMPSTRRMDQAEFNEYVEMAIAWLAQWCKIAVVPSDLFLAAREKGQTIGTRIQP